MSEVTVKITPTFSWISPKCFINSDVKFGYAGLFAAQDLPKNTTVVFWSGRIITEEELMKLPEDLDAYTLQLDEHLYQAPIIPNVREAADYTNHSCDPNAGFSSPVSLVLMRDVKAYEEITFDYAMSESNDAHGEFNCQCGSDKCRKIFTGKDWMDPQIQERYDGYFSPYLQKKVNKMREERVNSKTL